MDTNTYFYITTLENLSSIYEHGLSASGEGTKKLRIFPVSNEKAVDHALSEMGFREEGQICILYLELPISFPIKKELCRNNDGLLSKSYALQDIPRNCIKAIAWKG